MTNEPPLPWNWPEKAVVDAEVAVRLAAPIEIAPSPLRAPTVWALPFKSHVPPDVTVTGDKAPMALATPMRSTP